MGKKIAILQSNYIPWKGYFDLIESVDEFIFYDEMQYTKNDWRNRNKIKTPNGIMWLTIPVRQKGHLLKQINEIEIADKRWARKHWMTISNNYKKAPFFKDYKDIFENLYFSCEDDELLCEVNYKFIRTINKILEINTKISFSTDYKLIEGKTFRLVDLCKQANADEYISGPAAKDYIDKNLFKNVNVKLNWIDYSGYAPYPQLYQPFEHNVSILDLIFNCGPDSKHYMKGRKN